MKGRLNSFQKLALRWSELHPYNAVHVVSVAAAPNLERLRQTIEQTLSRRGLGRLRVDPTAGAYEFEPPSAVGELTVLAGQDGDSAVLQDEIERQLNRGFDLAQPFSPFRFFVLTGPSSFSFGLVYFHPAADAESVALLLKEIVETYSSGRPPAATPPDLYPPRLDGRWLRHPWLLLGWLPRLPALALGLRRSFRASYREVLDLRNAFTSVALPPPALATLTQTAKSLGVTLNDLFLALLLQALSPHAAGRRTHPARKCLSVGCVVNTRRDLGVDSGRYFGLFLASFTVTHALPPGIALADLAQAVRDQTRLLKRARLYLAAPVRYASLRLLLSFYSPERQKKFYPKHHPLWGGITNMNLNSLWPQLADDPPLGYLRAVSTGPATPLVLSITTLGEVIQLGLSYRPTVFSPAAIEQVKMVLLGAAGTFRTTPPGK
jgi:hypothetical protein